MHKSCLDSRAAVLRRRKAQAEHGWVSWDKFLGVAQPAQTSAPSENAAAVTSSGLRQRKSLVQRVGAQVQTVKHMVQIEDNITKEPGWLCGNPGKLRPGCLDVSGAWHQKSWSRFPEKEQV